LPFASFSNFIEKEKMNIVIEIITLIMPWFVFLVFVLLCMKMTDWARKRKVGAIAFGLLVQILLPDPKAQVTIESVVERKQEVKKQQEGDKTPKDENDKKGQGQ
jgi:hypothetical protein